MIENDGALLGTIEGLLHFGNFAIGYQLGDAIDRWPACDLKKARIFKIKKMKTVKN